MSIEGERLSGSHRIFNNGDLLLLLGPYLDSPSMSELVDLLLYSVEGNFSIMETPSLFTLLNALHGIMCLTLGQLTLGRESLSSSSWQEFRHRVHIIYTNSLKQ